MLKRFCESYRNIEQEIQDLNNPSDELANYIHKLKGISENLGLLKIHELAIDCEQDNFAEDSLLALIAASQEMVRKIEAAL
ncbi:hypothetical protein THIOSC13_1560001 [uncultured Thiomicrorhabdus sp.]